MLTAVFISESLTFISHFKYYSNKIDVIVMWLLVGCTMYFINYKNEWKSKKYLFSILLIILLGFSGYQLAYYITS